ncbi:MAG: magnesium transporter CorA family protein [Acidaminococcus sp.]|nr:magnesium transporter CorA family protein [Acidaminococcus sp.]MDD7398779.1 magnesium transporter CorA family protein [Bacillota bacterium]
MLQVISSDKEKFLSLVSEEQITPDYNFTDKWIHMSNPTDKEIEFISSSCAVPEEMIKAALDEEERARGERDDDISLIICDIPVIEEDDDHYTYSTMPFGIILTKTTIITVCLNETTIINDFIYGRVKNVSVKKKTRLLLQIQFKIATKYLQYLKQIDKTSQRIRTELEKSMRNKELIEMLDLEKSLVYITTSLRSNKVLLEKLPKIADFYEEDQELLDDVIIETNQAIEMGNIYSDILAGTMDAYASIISNNLNIVMKTLTVITILIAIPSMIASFWGMNTGVPFEGKPWGFWVVIALSIVICIITGIVMVKKKTLK